MASSEMGLGLGITFQPSPSPPESPHYSYEQQHQKTISRGGGTNQQQTLRPETSYYDVEKQAYAKSRTASGPMIMGRDPEREAREDGGLSKTGVRSRRIDPEYKMGGRDDIELDYRRNGALSPLSEFDDATSSTSESDGLSTSFSPASLSSLPSSAASAAAFFPQYRSSRPQVIRHVQSMGVLSSANQQYHRLNAPQYQHPQLPTPPTVQSDSSPVSSNRSPSRLPAFLLERNRKEALSRPKSMMELGQQAALQPHYSAPAIFTDGQNRMDGRREDYSREREQIENREEETHGMHSPESIPSSAGGLMRQQLERQLQDQHAAHQRALQQQQQQHRSSSRLEVEQPRQLPHRPSRSALRSSHSDSSQQTTHLVESNLPPLRTSFTSSANIESSSPTRLNRTGTLFVAGANPVNRAKELDRLLAPTGVKKVSHLAASPAATSVRSQIPSHSSSSAPVPFVAMGPVVLEQGKSASKARAELDLILESSLLVEGGVLRGKIELRVRKAKDGEDEVWMARPKVRVVGFEELTNHEEGRHVFYHHASSITTKDEDLPCFDPNADIEGFSRGRIGQHNVPFSMVLPIGKGAKGSWKGKQGVVRYIVIASIKLKSQSGADRSIAHFYRHVEIFPYLNPAIVLASALTPIVASASKSLFMGGSGLVNLTAKIHRGTWIAGQRCYVDVSVENDSSKKIKTLTLTLIRTTTVLRPRPWFDPTRPGDINLDDSSAPGSSQATKKKVAESVLEMGKKATKGVTAKGSSWMGVDKGEKTDFSHFLLVPPEELSISRGRHLEVSYSMKITVAGSLSTDVTTEIPIRVVNFVSIDPPPGHTGDATESKPKNWNIDELRPVPSSSATTIPDSPTKRLQRQAMARMISLESLRLSDFNLSNNRLSRVDSLDTLRTSNLSFVEPARPSSYSDASSAITPDHRERRDVEVVGRAKERSLQHQMSLDCISSAIASATARRSGAASPEKGYHRTQSALRVEIERTDGEDRWDENDDEGEDLAYDGAEYYGGGESRYAPYGSYAQSSGYNDENDRGEERVQLDDIDDDADQSMEDQPPSKFDDDDNSSEEELDAVMSQTCFDEEEPTAFDNSLASTLRLPPSPVRLTAQSRAYLTSPTRSPASLRTSPSFSRSPISDQSTLSLKSALKSQPRPSVSDAFGFATPRSPVKTSPTSTTPLPLAASPIRRQSSRAELPAIAPASIRRQQSRADLVTSPTSSSRSPMMPPPPKSTLRPSISIANLSSATTSRVLLSKKSMPNLSTLNKRPSIRSLRPPSSQSYTSSNPTSPDLDSTSTRTFSDTESSASSHRPMTDRYSSSKPYSRPMTGETRPTSSSSMPRRNSILPSIRSQVAAYETREDVLAGLRSTAGADGTLRNPANANLRRIGGGGGLNRGDSISSNCTTTSDAEFSMLTRGDSMQSFKAPLFRR